MFIYKSICVSNTFIIIIYRMCIALYKTTLKRCCEYYRIDSDFFNMGYISLKMSSVYQVHMYLYM